MTHPSGEGAPSISGDYSRWIRLALIAMMTGGGGFSLAEIADVSTSRKWREDNVERLMEAERNRDRIVALEAQAKVLAQLAERCARRGNVGDLRLFEPNGGEVYEDAGPEIIPVAPGELQWEPIQ